nr:hypothetical protein [uncultured Corynebacterium sp.]
MPFAAAPDVPGRRQAASLLVIDGVQQMVRLFAARLAEELGVDPMDRDALERVFGTRTTQDWVRWADDHDIPLTAVAAVSGS